MKEREWKKEYIVYSVGDLRGDEGGWKVDIA